MWDLPTPNAEPFIHVRLGKWSTTVGPVWPQLCSSKPISDSASSALQPELSGCLQVDISSATAYLPRLPSLTCLRCLIPIHLSNPQESAWASNSDQLPWCCCCCCLVTSVVSDPMQPYALLPTRLLCPWDSLDKSTGVGCRALLQRIFAMQGWNPHLFCLMFPALTGRFFTTSATIKNKEKHTRSSGQYWS